jgi:hypothetical protein
MFSKPRKEPSRTTACGPSGPGCRICEARFGEAFGISAFELQFVQIRPWSRFRPIRERPCLLGHALVPSAHAGSTKHEQVIYLRSKSKGKDVPEDTRSTVAGNVGTR